MHQSRQSPLLDLAAIRPIYPFAQRWLDLPQGRMHYLDEGPATVSDAAPPTLLFVHGNPTWSFHWRIFVTSLRAEHRCVAVDHIGCGLSEKPHRRRVRRGLNSNGEDGAT
jgi:pimeloyl-ACP methyl ester carboxylesterase